MGLHMKLQIFYNKTGTMSDPLWYVITIHVDHISSAHYPSFDLNSHYHGGPLSFQLLKAEAGG